MIDSGMMVQTVSGLVRACDLNAGQRVVSVDGSTARVTKVSLCGWSRHEAYEVQVGYRVIRLTASHHILSARGLVAAAAIRPAAILSGSDLAAIGIAYHGRVVAMSMEDDLETEPGDSAVVRCGDVRPHPSVGGLALCQKMALRNVERVTRVYPDASKSYCVLIEIENDMPVMEAEGVIVSCGE